MQIPKLDRLPQWDAHNDNFPVRRLIAAQAEKPLRSFTWPVGSHMDDQVVLDQGVEGACVGFAFAHELLAKPQRVPADARSARAIYAGAKERDEWEGSDYDGTSVLGGAKVLTEEGFYKSYAWSRDAHELASVLAYKGPVVLGINWHEDMWQPDSSGFIYPTGAITGGHAILCKGIAVARFSKRYGTVPAFTLHNSWGDGWGKKGVGYLALNDLQALLSAEGEACLPLRTTYADAV